MSLFPRIYYGLDGVSSLVHVKLASKRAEAQEWRTFDAS